MLDDVLHIDDLKNGKLGRSGLDRAERDELKNVLNKFLNNPYGREFLFNYLRSVGCFDPTTFDQSPTTSAYLEGQRCAGNNLMKRLKEISPDYVYMMIKEGESYGR